VRGRAAACQVKDAAQLNATSPIDQAARIKAPLLLAYGGSDRLVPIYHGRKFLNAVKFLDKHIGADAGK
jgi:dipeptidyl aminopeptidase/acylaminoacyl peptidase